MLALRRPFDGANLVEVAALIAQGEPLEAARVALEESGHPEELRRLASSDGLLHPVPSARTKLTSIIEAYPVAQSDVAESQVAEAALANMLAGPLRPKEGSVVGTSGAEDASDEMTSSETSGNPSHTSHPPSAYSSVNYSIQSMSRGASTLGGSSLTSLTSASALAQAHSCIPQECPMLPVAFQPRPDLFHQLLQRLLADVPGTGLAGASVAFGMGGTGKVGNSYTPRLLL